MKAEKAVLVIDVPTLSDGRHLCNECPIWNGERLICEYGFNMKTKGCPLRPLPKKKSFDDVYISRRFNADEIIGWNKCLKAITGEKE